MPAVRISVSPAYLNTRRTNALFAVAGVSLVAFTSDIEVATG